jgi:apolipoprotein N-acyltransferase
MATVAESPVRPAARVPVRPLPRVVALVAAVGAGAALLFSFPLYGWWWLAPVGVALLAVAVHGRRMRAGAGLGFLTGLVFFVPLLSWTALHVDVAPWLLLGLLEAAYLGLLGAVSAWVSPLVWRYPAGWPLVTGLGWVAQEALRGRTPFGGFPWGRLAFSQGDSPLLRWAVAGGAPLVTFLVAAAGGLLASALWTLWTPRTSWAAPARAAVLFALGAVAVVLSGFAVPLGTPSGAVVRVAIVQGNVPRMGLDFNAQRRAVLDNHVNATRALADRVAAGTEARPDLVVWPENSSDIDPLRNVDAAARIDQAARAIGVPILVGAVLAGPEPGSARNVGIVWDPATGPGQTYDKRHPVPFAEYMPWRSVIWPIAQFVSADAALLRNDFAAGTAPGVLRVGPAVLGDVICFEVADDGVVRDTVTGGGQLLAVQTNNATFDEAEARQQLAMVRLRAVEHGRDALMASTVGVSGFVMADGAVRQATGFNRPAVVVRQLRLGTGRTPATLLGGWLEWGLVALALAGLVVRARPAVAARRRGAGTRAGAEAGGTGAGGRDGAAGAGGTDERTGPDGRDRAVGGS